MARRTKDEAAATRETILEAATELFLRDGVSRSTLERIAREAGCTRGAVYHHFANKSELLHELLDSVQLPFEEMNAELDGSGRDDPLGAVQRWCERAFAFLLANPRARRIHTVLYHRCEFVAELNPVRDEEVSKILAHHEKFTRMFERAKELGQLRGDIEPKEASYMLHAFCVGLYASQLKEPWNQIATIRPQPMIDVFFQGIRAIST